MAALLLSLGLLGLASLQATSLRFASSVSQRSQATYLAYDIADRIRANRPATLDGAYDGQAFPETPPACSAVELIGTTAERDLQAWTTHLACQLPRGVGALDRTGAIVTITVRWDDSRGQDAPKQFLMETEL